MITKFKIFENVKVGDWIYYDINGKKFRGYIKDIRTNFWSYDDIENRPVVTNYDFGVDNIIDFDQIIRKLEQHEIDEIKYNL